MRRSGTCSRTNSSFANALQGAFPPTFVEPVQISAAALEGARASSADSELEGRGFRNVDGFMDNNTAYTIWYNRASGQCLQMTVADGRVYNIKDIGYNAGCR